jgi:hypothetical protein
MLIKYSFLCEAANLSNGSLNALGIFDTIRTLKFPCQHPRFTYVANIEFERSEVGKHPFILSFVGLDGKDVMPPLRGEITVNPVGLRNSLILQLNNIKFPEEGAYKFDLTVEGKHICTDILKVVQVKQIGNPPGMPRP